MRDGRALGANAAAAVYVLGPVVAGVALLQSPVAPDPFTWSILVVLAAVASTSVAVPVGVGVAAVDAGRRWVEEGGWTGLRAVGVRGRDLIPAALLLGLGAGVVTAGATCWMEPRARRWAHERSVQADVGVVLTPGSSTRIDSIELVPAAVVDGVAEDVFVASPDLVGFAGRVRVGRTSGRRALRAENVVMTGLGPTRWQVRFAEGDLPLDPPRTRLEVNARSNAELAGQAMATEAAGRDASYEWTVLFKRVAHPLGAGLLPLCVLPLGFRRRPLLALGVSCVGYLVAVRLGDHASAAVGPVVASAFGPGWIVTVGVVAWASWRDR